MGKRRSDKQPDLNHIIEPLQQFAVPIDEVKLDPRNARSHNEKNINAIKGSLQAYKQRRPLVVNKITNIIEAGNGNYEAALALGWKHIAVVYVEDDPATATGYAIADNRTSELAAWNNEELLNQLVELQHEEMPNDDLDAMLKELHSLQQVPEFQPVGENEQGNLSEIKKHKCPECGHEFCL